VLLSVAAHARSDAAAQAGDIDEIDRCLEIERSSAGQLDQPTLSWLHTLDGAWRAQIAGDTDRAEELADEALQIGTDGGEPDAAIFYSVQSFIVNWHRGTLDDLLPVVEEMILETPEIANVLQAALALAHAEADRTEEARDLLETFAGTGFELPWNVSWLTAMIDYAIAAIAVGDSKYAAPLLDRLHPWADQCASTGITAQGPVSHYLGGLASVLGRYDEANVYFGKASVTNSRTRARFFSAQTDLLWGKMLAERKAPGDAGKARDLLTNAHAVAATSGYGNVERQAADALKRLDG
jgi:tetratricopeptide (TPR) repeat protein